MSARRCSASRLAAMVAMAAMAAAFASTRQAHAAAGACAIDGVRVSLVDGGESSLVEVSARVRSLGDEPVECAIDWPLLTISAAADRSGSPSIAVVETFVDHALSRPLLLADGVATAAPHEWRGTVGPEGLVVAVRLVVEGSSDGLRVEVPRAIFPTHAIDGARIERRVKSARGGQARFGETGTLDIAPSPAGAAGGMGPTMALSQGRVVAEMVPGEAPVSASVAPAFTVLDLYRQELPMRALDLSAENDQGWDELAKRAYAAALHSDPVVASLGVATLAWLGGGLDLRITRIGASASPDVAAVPHDVLDAIGDVDARLQGRFAAVGHLLPLGRTAVFRRALTADPSHDVARSKAAIAAVARLAGVSPASLVAFVPPSIVDATAPVDPPVPGLSIATVPSAAPPDATSEPDAVSGAVAQHAARPSQLARARWLGKRRRRRMIVGAIVAALLASVGLAMLLRQRQARAQA